MSDVFNFVPQNFLYKVLERLLDEKHFEHTIALVNSIMLVTLSPGVQASVKKNGVLDASTMILPAARNASRLMRDGMFCWVVAEHIALNTLLVFVHTRFVGTLYSSDRVSTTADSCNFSLGEEIRDKRN